MTVTDSIFTSNAAGGFGGAIYNSGTLSLESNNVFSGNTDSTGANDIYNAGTITVAGGTTTIGGGISAVAQGKVAASSINILAKKPDHWSKGMILCITVEFYAILSLLASMLMLLNI